MLLHDIISSSFFVRGRVMFCTNCGAEVSDDSSFCTECGTSIKPLSESELEKDRTAALDLLNKTAEFPVVEGQPFNNTAYYSQPTQAASAATAQMPTAQAPIPNNAPCAQGVGGVQGGAQTAAKSGNSGLMIAALVVGILAIVVCATLLILAVTKPPIDFLKDTPFSSVQTEEQAQVANSSNNNDDNGNSGNSNSSNNSNSNSQNNNSNSGSSNSSSSNSNTYSNSNGQIMPYSSTARLSLADIKGFTNDQLCIAKNEIWARHGRKFDNNWLQNHFNQQSWYTPTTNPDDFLKVYTPTDIENDNAEFLNSILIERGYEVNKVHPN